MMTKGPSDITNENINAETLVIKKPPMLEHVWKTNHWKKKFKENYATIFLLNIIKLIFLKESL